MVSTRASSVRGDSMTPEVSLPVTPAGTASVRAKRGANSSSSLSRSSSSTGAWTHTPDNLTLLWLYISLPLVVWDTVYVLGRPHTMAGGWLHWPMYVPYVLYGNTDYIYGWPAFEARNGFTSAQGLLNFFETIMYLSYLYVYLANGVSVGAKGAKKAVSGRPGALALLIGYSAAVMTFSKTVLYWANEYYSGFSNIGHNATLNLIFLWIIPNGAWFIGSGWMIYALGGNIVDAIAGPSARSKKD